MNARVLSILSTPSFVCINLGRMNRGYNTRPYRVFFLLFFLVLTGSIGIVGNGRREEKLVRASEFWVPLTRGINNATRRTQRRKVASNQPGGFRIITVACRTVSSTFDSVHVPS